VHGDRVQLQQLLLNLVVNAMDAMDGIPAAQRVITVGTEQRDDGTNLYVADRGPGVSPLAAANVFEPFWSTKDSGMGIGLALCRTIAQAHGGSLDVSAAPGGGALFRATFPTGAPA
jgi:C4-dicarboxylate-specific signal transduction histidine kinase